MNSVEVYKIDLWIWGKKFTHPVNVIHKLNDNIISIDFMYTLTYDMHTRQVKFTDFYPNTICATKQVDVPAMTSSMVNVKFKGEVTMDKSYIANIHCPNNPTVSGMPA